MDYGLEDAHEAVGCKPSFIGSHTVEGAENAQKSFEVLKWLTKDERQLQIRYRSVMHIQLILVANVHLAQLHTR